MDKEFLIRLNNSFKKIKTALLLNENIRTYLYYDEVAQDTIAPPIEVAAEHVFTQPVIEVDTTEPFNKKNYITITMPEGNKENNKIDYVIRVMVMCDKHSWNINGDSRPLLLGQEIVDVLDNYKLDFSNKLRFSNIMETVTSNNVYGYSFLFDVTDGISDSNEK